MRDEGNGLLGWGETLMRETKDIPISRAKFCQEMKEASVKPFLSLTVIDMVV